MAMVDSTYLSCIRNRLDIYTEFTGDFDIASMNGSSLAYPRRAFILRSMLDPCLDVEWEPVSLASKLMSKKADAGDGICILSFGMSFFGD
jgi:hypothetical protein